MLKVCGFIVDKRNLFFLLFGLLMIFSVFSRNWVSVENSMAFYLPQSTETKQGLDLMEEQFMTYGSCSCMVANVSYEQALSIQEKLKNIDGVFSVDFDDTDAHYNNGSALFSVTFDYDQTDDSCLDSLDEVRNLLETYDSYIATDLGNIQAELISDEMDVISVLVAIIVVSVLLLTSQAYAEVPVLLITFCSAALIQMGTNFLLGTISFVSNSVTIVLQLALSVDYAVIFLNRYKEEHQLLDAREATIVALSKAIPEISGSSLTTIGGLIAMTFMQYRMGPDLGIVLVKSILISLLSVFLLMPGIIMLFSRLIDKTQHKNLIPDIPFVGRFAYSTRFFIAPLFVVVIIGAFFMSNRCPYVFGYSKITTPLQNKVQKVEEMQEETFGSTNMVALVVPTGDYEKEKRLLADLDECPEVKSTLGLANSEAMNGYMVTDKLSPRQFSELLGLDYEIAELVYTAYAVNDEDYAKAINGLSTYKVPLIDMLMFVHEEVSEGYVTLDADLNEKLDDAYDMMVFARNQLQGEGYDRMLIYLNLPQESDETFDFLKKMHQIAGKYYPDDGHSVFLVGESVSQRDLKDTFSRDNLVVNIMSILTVLVVLLFTFKSAGMPVLLIIVIQGSIWINFSIPYLKNDFLFFLGYLIVSSIQMGANIDYAIVIASRYTELRAKMDRKEAIIDTMNLSFPTIITSGTMLAVAGILIGNLTSDGAIYGIGQCIGRGTIISIFITMFVLPQILLVGDTIIEKTAFVMNMPIRTKSGKGYVRIDGVVRGQVEGIVTGVMHAMVRGNVNAFIEAGELAEMTMEEYQTVLEALPGKMGSGSSKDSKKESKKDSEKESKKEGDDEENHKSLMCLFMAVLLIFQISAGFVNPVTLYAKPDKKSGTEEKPVSEEPTIEVVYTTGTQQNAKDRKDETDASANEDDGSYEEIILTDTAGEIPEEWEDIHIASVEDFIAFANNCKLDTWSRNKRVFLDADLIIGDVGFTTIPTFGGYFDGQGHTIEGFIYTKPVSYYGLFSYIQENAIVKNLAYKASICPSGKQMITGGICGDNSGQIINCSFNGSVKGYNYVGGIAGYNELTGIISECKAEGSISGAHYTGGIAGENVGLISSCVNYAKVNTEIIDRGMTLEEIDIATVTAGLFSFIGGTSDKKDTQSTIIDSGSIDSGGIAGFSIGVIQFCINDGDVGYEHVGYNTGGIAGRQSGYINSCTNRGHIYGRKDIGGIVGQAEPYVIIDFTKDVINKLNESINKLHDIVAVTIDDAGDESDIISSRLNVIKSFTDKALENTSFLSDRTVEWTDELMGKVNEFSGRAEYILRESSKSDGPINDARDAFSDTERAADALEATVKDLDVESYMDSAQKIQYEDAKGRFKFLSKNLSENETKYTKAAQNYYIYKMRNDTDGGVPKYPNSADSSVEGKLVAYMSDGNPIDVSSFPLNFDDWEKVSYWKHADGTDFGSKDGDNTLASDALNALNSAGSFEHFNKTDVDNKAAEKTAEAYEGEPYYTKISGTPNDVRSEMATQGSIMADIIIAVTPDMEEAAGADAKKAAQALSSAADNLKDAGSKTNSIISNVAGRGSIVFPQLGDEYRQKTNDLVAALQGMSDNMGKLNGEMENGSDVMLSDMGDINDQFNEIMRLYADAIDGVLDNDYSENYEDTSMLVAESCTDATVVSCENDGRVEGDIDVSGIAGTMGIEYDFDLESDITRTKDSSILSNYQSKCVLRRNKNNGAVNAQKNYIGGVCGLQEMGTILSCENYGRIDSEAGEYVGGIAGNSYSYIQKSYSKCSMSGSSYVAGIAGYGTNILNCYSMVRIADAKAYKDAIAGDVEEGGKVRYNYFVSDELAGIDRVSYAGKAEPVGYYVLTGLSGIPSEFSSFKVVFYLDEDDGNDPAEVKSLKFKYGETLPLEEYPQIDDKEGFYAVWDIKEVNNIRFDEDITAAYKRYITTLASKQLRLNMQSAILVDGHFHEDDELECKEMDLNATGLKNAKEHWLLNFRDDGSDTHLVRYKKPDNMKNTPIIYINHAGKWEKAKPVMFGEYETFDVTGSFVEIAVCETIVNEDIYVIAGVCAGAVVLAILLIIIIKSIKKRKKDKDDKEDKADDKNKGKPDDNIKGNKEDNDDINIVDIKDIEDVKE